MEKCEPIGKFKSRLSRPTLEHDGTPQTENSSHGY